MHHVVYQTKYQHHLLHNSAILDMLCSNCPLGGVATHIWWCYTRCSVSGPPKGAVSAPAPGMRPGIVACLKDMHCKGTVGHGGVSIPSPPYMWCFHPTPTPPTQTHSVHVHTHLWYPWRQLRARSFLSCHIATMPGQCPCCNIQHNSDDR